MVASKKDKETPAEQLLRMIEGGSGPAVSPGTPSSPIGRAAALVQSIRGRFWFRRRMVRRNTDAMLGNIRLGQRVLWIVLLGLTAYLAAEVLLVKPRIPVSRITASGETPTTVDSGTEGTANPLRPLSEYLAAVEVRNPFTGSGATSAPPVVSAKQRLEEMAQGLAVVGIDRGEHPEALIEDSKLQRTYFVKVGDTLNGMTISEINPQGVVLTYEGEEFLLH